MTEEMISLALLAGCVLVQWLRLMLLCEGTHHDD